MYRIIKTDDGTETLFRDDLQEAMHSTSGAYEEALLKHVLPSRILEKNKGHVRALDVGFGIGYNALALIAEHAERDPGIRLSIVSLERDLSCSTLIKKIRFGDERDRYYEIVKEACLNGEYTSDSVSMRVIFGDARNTVRQLGGCFDAVFHDPYSPSKNPELWTVDFFRELYRLTCRGSVVTTYSSAARVRRAFYEAGFMIGRGPSVGKKKEGTLASNRGDIPVFSDAERERILALESSVPYRDPGLADTAECIIQRRELDMKSAGVK